jgi:hypothetical protein
MNTAGRATQRFSSPCTRSFTPVNVNMRRIHDDTPYSAMVWRSRLRTPIATPAAIDGSNSA